jgi:hypothetical protein
VSGSFGSTAFLAERKKGEYHLDEPSPALIMGKTLISGGPEEKG